MTPEALLLDLDGTLLDWVTGIEAGVRAGAIRVAERFGLNEAEVIATTLGFEAEVYEVHATGWLLGGVGVNELYGALWQRTLDVYGLDPAPLPELVAAQWAGELGAFRAFDDVEIFLEAIAAAGIRTALVTNGPSEVQRAKLDAVGLADAFDAVLISAELGAAKPDARIFEAALAALDVDPARTWHIGDSLEYDIAGARGVGLEAVWVNRRGWTHGRHQPQPNLEVSGLAELVQLLARAA